MELGLFVLAWTLVKVFCFDAGGVVLALASGILFGGVWEGAVVSAFAATVGSSVAFGMAKVESPVRKKALEVVEEYPSLRGIEKVRRCEDHGWGLRQDCILFRRGIITEQSSGCRLQIIVNAGGCQRWSQSHSHTSTGPSSTYSNWIV